MVGFYWKISFKWMIRGYPAYLGTTSVGCFTNFQTPALAMPSCSPGSAARLAEVWDGSKGVPKVGRFPRVERGASPPFTPWASDMKQ